MLKKPKGRQVQTKSVVCEKGGRIRSSRIIIGRRRRRGKKKKKKKEEEERRRRVGGRIVKGRGLFKFLQHRAGVSKGNCVRLQQNFS
jgi:hypothetical protein